MTESSKSDQALRTICTDGNFRILIANTTHTVAGILGAQSPDAEFRPILTDLISAAVLLRLTMSPENRLQAILQNRSVGSLVADSHPDGITRGLIRRRGDAPMKMGESTMLSVHRTMYDGEIHQGVVETSADQTIADAVTGYLHQSEQITSVAGLGHRFDGDQLTFAGGYIIQHMPEDAKADKPTLAIMTARLQQLPPVPALFKKCAYDTQAVAEMLFGPIEFKSLATDDFYAGCTCSDDQVLDAMRSLSDAEIDEITADAEVLSVDCDYCAAVHTIDPADIRA